MQASHHIIPSSAWCEIPILGTTGLAGTAAAVVGCAGAGAQGGRKACCCLVHCELLLLLLLLCWHGCLHVHHRLLAWKVLLCVCHLLLLLSNETAIRWPAAASIEGTADEEVDKQGKGDCVLHNGHLFTLHNCCQLHTPSHTKTPTETASTDNSPAKHQNLKYGTRSHPAAASSALVP
jgi:hypothetical protein